MSLQTECAGREYTEIQETPFLSIVVLAYQVEPYLKQCLTSVLTQTFSDFEVLLIDDGSTDGTAAICDAFAAQDSRIRVIHQRNAGIVRARKAGIEQARGTYLAAVDGDDWIERNMYEILCAAAKETKADIVQCNAIGNYPRRRVRLEAAGLQPGLYKGEEYRFRIREPLTGESLIGSQLFFNSLCNKIIRRELLARAFSGMDDRCSFGEDAACSLFCAAWADSMVHIDHCLYHYRQRPRSSTHSFDLQVYERILALWDYMLSRQEEFQPHVARQMDMVALRLLVMAFGSAYVYGTGPVHGRQGKMKVVLSDERVRSALRSLPLSSQSGLRRRRLLLMMKLGLAPFRCDVTVPADKMPER